MSEKLPDWVIKATEEEWEKFKQEEHCGCSNCGVCGKRLLLTLCKHGEKKNYCVEHCPKHKWQSDYDWQTECAKCGVSYVDYLQELLKKNNIKY
jgi:hypothetical protein